MADLTQQQIEYRAKLTAQFLASDVWPELVERVERRAFEAFKSAKSTPAERETLWQMLQGFELAKRELRVIRDRGNLDLAETE